MCTWTLRQTSQTDNEFISQVNWDQLHCVRAMVNWWPLQLSKPVNYTYWKMRVHQWIQQLEIKIKLNYWRILLPKLWLKMIIAPLLWQLTSKNSESNRISRDFSCLTSYQTYSNHLHFQFFFCSNSEDGSESDGTSFHRVFIYDQGLRQYIQNKLKKSDRILLNGKIGHMTSTGSDGKKVYSGFIVADNLYRIARRTHPQSESNENTEVKAEN